MRLNSKQKFCLLSIFKYRYATQFYSALISHKSYYSGILYPVSSFPAAFVAVFLCLRFVSTYLLVLLLYHSLVSAADKLLFLAVSQLGAVM